MAKKNKHFSGLGVNELHTDRNSPQCKRGSACSYQKAQEPLKYAPSRAHHIIPVATFIEYQSDEAYEAVVSKISAVYRETDYCANRKKNIISLPSKSTYSKRPKKRDATDWPDVWKLNLPCHNWDHCPQYNTEVKNLLAKKIWKKFVVDPPPEEGHPDKEAVATSFDQIEDHFHTQLTVDCPKRPYGSVLEAIKAGAAEEPKPNWWHAFSMAMKVRDEPVFVFAKKSRVPVPQR